MGPGSSHCGGCSGGGLRATGRNGESHPGESGPLQPSHHVSFSLKQWKPLKCFKKLGQAPIYRVVSRWEGLGVAVNLALGMSVPLPGGEGMAPWTRAFPWGWTDRHGQIWEMQSRLNCPGRALRARVSGRGLCSSSRPSALVSCSLHGCNFSSLSLSLTIASFKILLLTHGHRQQYGDHQREGGWGR